jgi:hypothetical protein
MHNTKTKNIVFFGILTVVVCGYFVINVPALKDSLYIGTTAPYDFPHDYIGGRQLIEGKSIYPDNYDELLKNLLVSQGIKPNPHILFINPHPPFVDMLLFPLWLLNFHNAAVFWCLIEILCMLFINYLLLKSENISMKYFPLIVLFTLAWQPFQSNLIAGQITILIALFVVLAWFFYKKKYETTSGVFIGMATMLKFYPGFFVVYFLINKKWKAFLSSIITVGVILLLTLIVTKHDFFRFIFIIMPQDLRFWQADLVNFSINGFFSRLFLPMITYNTTAFTIIISPFIKNLFYYTAVGLLLLYLLFHIKKYNYNNGTGFSLFAILTLVISPFCWDHYRTLFLLSIVILSKELIKRKNIYETLIFLISLFFISINEYSVYFEKAVHNTQLLLFPDKAANIVVLLTFYSLPIYGMLLLLYLNFRIIKKTGIDRSE